MSNYVFKMDFLFSIHYKQTMKTKDIYDDICSTSAVKTTFKVFVGYNS